MKISQVFKDFKGRKGSPTERRRGRRQGRGAKEVALQMSPATCRYPGIMGLHPRLPGRIRTQPYQKSHQNRTKIQVLCQEEVISLFRGPLSRFQSLDQGTRKKGKDRKG